MNQQKEGDLSMSGIALDPALSYHDIFQNILLQTPTKKMTNEQFSYKISALFAFEFLWLEFRQLNPIANEHGLGSLNGYHHMLHSHGHKEAVVFVTKFSRATILSRREYSKRSPAIHPSGTVLSGLKRRATGWMAGVGFPTEERNFSLLLSVQNSSRIQDCKMSTGDYFHSGKEAGA
jgi:hypothetical protein